MKKVFTLATLMLALVLTTTVSAQDFSGIDKSPMDMAAYPTDYKVSEKAVRIIYGRPQLKGRSMEELAPTGKVWRTGANEAPEITFYKDVKFGGKDVKAGTYSLFTIPGADEWTVILNKNLNQWGSYFYDEASDVARVTVPNGSDAASLEEFSIAFKDVNGGAQLVMGWDKTRVAVPITM
ncbi:hypothetical protein LCGC14_0319500 [marine sediment metagenome]|uniref:DUF2911 domain-containing protein n=1 Tax=marine sediment metagenome TaxID=412755 RepID=A0A0F9U2F3_9ZZZZ|nr:DUF2911 domain-containing protein [Maribacter sp.]HDZ06604.1 DUF2911 domain-containing protein [Maribacter sp.]HEA81073.1 DUF2911 domain-containing protein [Maribacter sp.]